MSEEPETTATTNNDDIPEDFHPYVRLLIIRMRSHPEEFNPLLAEPDPNKKDFMTYDEKQFVRREERKLVMDASHETLMRQIMKANEPEEDLNETTIAKQLQAWQQMNAMQSNSVLYNRIFNADASAPKTTNFGLRGTLMDFDPENTVPNARGWLSWAMLAPDSGTLGISNG